MLKREYLESGTLSLSQAVSNSKETCLGYAYGHPLLVPKTRTVLERSRHGPDSRCSLVSLLFAAPIPAPVIIKYIIYVLHPMHTPVPFALFVGCSSNNSVFFFSTSVSFSISSLNDDKSLLFKKSFIVYLRAVFCHVTQTS